MAPETEPTPAAAEPARSQSAPGPSTRRLHLFKHLAFQARRLDRLLVRLSAIFASPTATDALLGTLAYTLELLAALLSRLLAHRLSDLASSIADKADGVLLPGETFIATLPATPSDQLLARALTSSKALAALVGDYRIFVRLWGLAGLYTWARELWNRPLAKEASPKDRAVRRITWAQIASLVLFQVLENGAYLSSKGVLTSDGWSGKAGKNREARWWVWSSRFWAAHVALELLRLGLLRYREARGEGHAKEKELVGDGEKEGKLLLQQKKRERWLWWRDAVSNIAYMPMTLHWSVEAEKGFLSDWGVGALGAIAGASLLVDAWKQTA